MIHTIQTMTPLVFGLFIGDVFLAGVFCGTMLLAIMFEMRRGRLAAEAARLDIIRLVIAARRAFDLGYSDEEFRELDQALEAFSARVPYDNED
jgi:hypothetical protein